MGRASREFVAFVGNVLGKHIATTTRM